MEPKAEVQSGGNTSRGGASNPVSQRPPEAPVAGPGAARDESDGELVRRAQQGDATAFDRLVLKYQDRIFGLCYRRLGDYEKAQDVAQESFVKAYRAIARFKLESEFYTWLFRIALNTAMSARRRRRVDDKALSIDRSGGGGEDERRIEPLSTLEAPEDAAERSETARLVRGAIADLPPEHGNVIVLKDIDGLSYEEMAEVLECPLGSVKSKLHRARKLLAERLKGKL